MHAIGNIGPLTEDLIVIPRMLQGDAWYPESFLISLTISWSADVLSSITTESFEPGRLGHSVVVRRGLIYRS